MGVYYTGKITIRIMTIILEAASKCIFLKSFRTSRVSKMTMILNNVRTDFNLT